MTVAIVVYKGLISVVGRILTVELYGSAAAGISLKRHSETGLTDAGKKAAQKTDLNTAFAYQVNPIALRVGNDRIGGFVEAGLGHKGFLTAGVSVKF